MRIDDGAGCLFLPGRVLGKIRVRDKKKGEWNGLELFCVKKYKATVL